MGCVYPEIEVRASPEDTGTTGWTTSRPPIRHDPRRRSTIAFFLVLLGGAIALVVIGAVGDGMLYLLSIGMLLLIAALYLLVPSVSRSRRRSAH
jgi:hypothetical protein